VPQLAHMLGIQWPQVTHMAGHPMAVKEFERNFMWMTLACGSGSQKLWNSFKFLLVRLFLDYKQSLGSGIVEENKQARKLKNRLLH